ncbi:hypothetical protein NDU88_003219 [Pleurodeles waltl]|uniref:Uncharacterized protein n=1 Tax=Pleurodeles waltl TaxID=8319 RepID=A0AAV7UXV5_PLEWA|nr:hypothetical protein NDU88_003219 [Pleurodeles waltl]
MDACNFDTLSRDELLKLYKQKGLKSDEKATRQVLQVALTAFQEVQRWQATSEEDEVDDNNEDGASSEGEDPDQGPEFPGDPNSTAAMTWIPLILRKD